ncbi:MAG TPA: ester cyclase [Noviherbaspirillum sp.]|nr:ester cyclase [Noviherbaspirillum sp.]
MNLSVRETNRRLLHEHLNAENWHRLEETLATLAPDCVFEDVALQRTFHGHAGAAEYYRMWWSAFDIQVERGTNAFWASDDLLVSEPVYTGTHVGNFLGIPATGNPICFRFVVFVRFRDGKFAGERFYYDLATLLRQIGVHELPALIK